MKEISSKKPEKLYIYLYILISLFASALIFSIFLFSFKLLTFKAYQTIAFSFGVTDTFLLFLLAIAELISLGFDKTASKNTLCATIFLFIGYFFTKDAESSFNLLGVTYPSILNIIFLNIYNIISYLFVYFIFRFFEEIFNANKNHKFVLYFLLFFIFTNVMMSIFDLRVALLISSIIEAVVVSVFAGIYLHSLKKKNSDAYVSFILILLIATSLIFNSLSFMDISFLGMTSLLYLIMFIGYVFIYAHFMIEKTNRSYQLEEDISKKEKAIILEKMKVSCFHSFDCYFNNMHVDFPSKKSKEFFALLVVLNGKSLTMDKAITYLWPDKDIELAKRSYRDVIYKLRRYVNEINFTHIKFVRAETSLDIDSIECDYLDVINHKAIYDGSPLMPEYDWSLEFENNL